MIKMASFLLCIFYYNKKKNKRSPAFVSYLMSLLSRGLFLPFSLFRIIGNFYEWGVKGNKSMYRFQDFIINSDKMQVVLCLTWKCISIATKWKRIKLQFLSYYMSEQFRFCFVLWMCFTPEASPAQQVSRVKVNLNPQANCIYWASLEIYRAKVSVTCAWPPEMSHIWLHGLLLLYWHSSFREEKGLGLHSAVLRVVPSYEVRKDTLGCWTRIGRMQGKFLNPCTNFSIIFEQGTLHFLLTRAHKIMQPVEGVTCSWGQFATSVWK